MAQLTWIGSQWLSAKVLLGVALSTFNQVVSGSWLPDQKETRWTCCRSLSFHLRFRNKICEGCPTSMIQYLRFDFLLKSNPNVQTSKPHPPHEQDVKRVKCIGTFSSKRMVTFTAPPETWAASWGQPGAMFTWIAHWFISLSNPDHSERRASGIPTFHWLPRGTFPF